MLETELKRLNENIERLNAILERIEVASDRNAETARAMREDVKTPKTTSDDAPSGNDGYTTDDIKAMALAISRKDRSKQKDIKAKLNEHKAKVATDLSGDDLQVVGEWLSALKDEIGA